MKRVLRSIMVTSAMVFCFGLHAGESARAGPAFFWRISMSESPKTPVVPVSAPPTNAAMKSVIVMLRDLDDPRKVVDAFGIRFPEKYQFENLQDLYESFKLKGMLEPPIIARGADGKWCVVIGHRRIALHYCLAERASPGYSLDMPITCQEVDGSNQLDLLVRSISSNEIGEKLDPKERLVGTARLDAAKATRKEIASAFNVVEKSVDRDLRIVRNPRVLDHVMSDHLPPTTASTLVEVATKANRLGEFLDYFDGWVKRAKDAIAADERRYEQEHGKGLKPSQVSVMNRLERHVVRGWIESLAKGKPLTEKQDLGFEAAFDKKTGVATIRVKVDARIDEPDHVARVAGQVSQVAKHLAAFAQTRRMLESPLGPQAALQNDNSLLDTELLKEFGLQDVAAELDRELRPPTEPNAATEPKAGK